eukprot:5035651-Pyramimonas_sp.AAC.1
MPPQPLWAASTADPPRPASLPGHDPRLPWAPRSPDFAHRAPRCATRDYLGALAPSHHPLAERASDLAQTAMREARLLFAPPRVTLTRPSAVT